MLTEARELSARINISEMSLKLLGYDIRHDGPIENRLPGNGSVPPSPSKSPSKKRRTRSRSQGDQAANYAAVEVLLDMEYVIWAYNALEEFQDTWEQLEKYDPISFFFYTLANRPRSKNTEAEDSAQMVELQDQLQMAIESATEHTEALLDKDRGTLMQRRSGKTHPFLLLVLQVTNSTFQRRRMTF